MHDAKTPEQAVLAYLMRMSPRPIELKALAIEADAAYRHQFIMECPYIEPETEIATESVLILEREGVIQRACLIPSPARPLNQGPTFVFVPKRFRLAVGG